MLDLVISQYALSAFLAELSYAMTMNESVGFLTSDCVSLEFLIIHVVHSESQEIVKHNLGFPAMHGTGSCGDFAW